ncbi:hypothetical protein ADIMK_2911 [Marinobacterium lacunae]|uniref:Uncharacterized protein n=1 Tax=Marinobacterium lacunae TaxID=1232683 RepID=A0A081FWN6_9GAMM|nr:hypothetical protein ADIMK_2911 [Marinobacterium lacunae]
MHLPFRPPELIRGDEHVGREGSTGELATARTVAVLKNTEVTGDLVLDAAT